MKKVMMKLIAAAGIMTVLGGSQVYAGWEQDENGYLYVYDSNAYARGEIADIDGVKYYFNYDAYMTTGWVSYDGNWYYFDPASGAMKTGWVSETTKENNVDVTKWYYMDPTTGAMKTGRLIIGANHYYLNESGVMQTGQFAMKDSPYCYEADANGVIIRNKLEEDYKGRNGLVVQYKDDGTMLYRTDTTATLDSSWKEMMYGEWREQQTEELAVEQREGIEDTKEELKQSYIKNVYPARSRKTWSSRLEKWKTQVNQKLLEKGASQEEIDGYINDITSLTYSQLEDVEYSYDPEDDGDADNDGEYDSPEDEYGSGDDYDYWY